MGDKNSHLGKRRVCRHERRKERQQEAAERKAQRDTRSDREQLGRLKYRPGKSKRERSRLRKKVYS